MDILNELNNFLEETPIEQEVSHPDDRSLRRLDLVLNKLMAEEDTAEYSYTDSIKQIDKMFNNGRITKEFWSEIVKVLEEIREDERSHKYQLRKLITKLGKGMNK